MTNVTASGLETPTMTARSAANDARLKRVPTHVAVIMDGNGRWARRRALPRGSGHIEGAKSVTAVLKESLVTDGLTHLTLFALGRDNLRKRPKDELNGLFTLMHKYIQEELHTLMEENVKLRIIGDMTGLPDDAQKELADAIELTASNTGKVLCTALNYSSHDELVRSVRRIARKTADASLDPERIDERTIDDHLDTAGMPPVDLLIRTSGEMRLSDFLLWQVSYAELYVTKTLWPDFRKRHFRKALEAYARRQRRFGGVKS